jgi:hypothetical protein
MLISFGRAKNTSYQLMCFFGRRAESRLEIFHTSPNKFFTLVYRITYVDNKIGSRHVLPGTN